VRAGLDARMEARWLVKERRKARDAVAEGIVVVFVLASRGIWSSVVVVVMVAVVMVAVVIEGRLAYALLRTGDEDA
jgi:hypothetical protein